MISLNIILIVVLIIATAFFVATEFAIVKLRPSRVDQLVLEGKKNAKSVQKVTQNLDGYLAACQLGITLTALGLGWLGEPTVELLLHPIFEQIFPVQLVSIISFVIAFSAITFLHVVLGELAPKTVAIQKAEAVSFLLARPITLFYRVLYPFIWILNGSASRFIRLFGMKPAKEHGEIHSEEELRIILTESYQGGEINQSEYGYVSNIFSFDELLAREIMIPRTDMVCLYKGYSLKESLNIIKQEKYTRFPIITENKDDVIGMINTKEFFLKYFDNPNLDITTLIRPILTTHDSTPIRTLLNDMQRKESHIAILIDEFGGTTGMVTIEDILEEIVGEIRDEFDSGEKNEIETIGESHLLVDGKVLITEINDLLEANICNEEVKTIGGWLYSQNEMIDEGEKWHYENLTFIIRKKEKHRIRKVEIIKDDEII